MPFSVHIYFCLRYQLTLKIRWVWNLIQMWAELWGMWLSSLDVITVSPRREARTFSTEGGLASEFTSHGLFGESIVRMTVDSGLWVKHRISLSMLTYKQQLLGESGFSEFKLVHPPINHVAFCWGLMFHLSCWYYPHNTASSFCSIQWSVNADKFECI